ncbi:response regulator transcription factor [Bacillus sp. FJAT-45066]|uniref:response regulator transcription factor n=1 Tax=Bacillus sp. FJAT-45066 TaxID=2011010 RepID=UPI000BB74DCB|nr:response regulator [Bacillus sp. FJAT-45066]
MAKILLAEDEEVLRMLVVDTLEDEGHDIVETSDGEEALKHIEEEAFDLIILDYMMPMLTGLEVIEKVMHIPERKNSKILMLSAKSQKNDQERVLQAGATHFMSKPFSPMELAQKVEEIISEN